jgi:Flp pilus assembly protein TadG
MGNRLMGNQKRERGAALAEAAIVMPLLLALVFGIWTIARAWNVRSTMEHAVREGVRFGSTELPWDGTTSISEVEDVVHAELQAASIPVALVNTQCIDVNSAPCGFTATSQGYDQVAVRIQYPDYPLNFLFFSTTVDLTVESVGRYEG